jgi:hypothetical protein
MDAEAAEGRGEPAWVRGAFWTSLIMLGFEVLAHRQLQYVGGYLETAKVISIAVMGIALGAIGANAVRRWPPDRVLLLGATALGISVLGNVVAFPFLGEHLPSATPLLLLPFAIGGGLVALSFTRAPIGRVYLYDLVGAGCGVAVVAALLPTLGEEGAHAAWAALALLTPWAYGLRAPRGWRRALRYGTGGIACLLVIFAIANSFPRGRWYNLAIHTRATGVSARRVFNQAGRQKRGKRVVHSRSSLAGRTDILKRGNRHSNYENGKHVDLVRKRTFETYIWDPRVPRGVLPDNPDIFIIGTAGEGILKSVRALGANVYGAEINPAIYEILSGPKAAICGHCYEGIEPVIGDGRTVLAGTDRRFDMITMLNTHVAKVSKSPASVEFIYTREAMDLFLDRLKPTGMINVEEVILTRRKRPNSSGTTRRIVTTAVATLAARGVQNPADHIIVFRWKSMGHYDQILIRRTPWDAESLAKVRAWWAHVREAKGGVDAAFGSAVWSLHMPDEPGGRDPVAKYLRTGKYSKNAPPMRSVPITDERPYPFQRERVEPKVVKAFRSLLLYAGLLILLPFGLAVWRSRSGSRRRVVASAAVAALLGLAYLLVEIIFIQQLQLLVGSVSVSFVTVLGGMLVASGCGGFFAARLRPGVAMAAALGALPLLLAAQALLIPAVADVAVVLPLWGRALVALALIAGPAALMGFPLPILLDHIKRQGGAEQAALLFGVNAGFSAFGTLLAFLTSMAVGFSQTYLLACGLYAVAVLLMVPLLRGPARAIYSESSSSSANSM